MIKILHSADWHLDSPLLFRNPEQSRLLRNALRQIPGKIAALCKQEGCDMMLLSGDLFDGAYSADTLQAVKTALAEVSVPVFIAPGNHDYIGQESPWISEAWPENVHIFTHPVMESVTLENLDCQVYGAGFTGMDCDGLLADFAPKHTKRYAVGVLHGDPTQVNSPYCPVTAQQVQNSGFDYLALGHIHKGDQFRAGKTLCAWPGCPMGRGYDEQGQKGVLIVTLDEAVATRFVPLDAPKFFDLELPAGQPLSDALPPVGNYDFYRITLTGPSEPLDLGALAAEYSRFPNLELRDRTTPPVDVWGSAGSDTFEGIYFGLLQDALTAADSDTQRHIRLAAQISRQLLDGQEVVLP
ncbi:MAG: metallophosphoesterase [Oscillospiraceae bacterium]|nr:metallophosphoesterase [Oscillospiraceae bacterium]